MKRKKLLIFTLVTSVGGLVVDRVFLNGDGPAPAAASPQTLMAMGEAALTGQARAADTRAKPSRQKPTMILSGVLLPSSAVSLSPKQQSPMPSPTC
ncbi:MAG: hypothetical protein AAF297_05065 [Planctomycetota bacterium]